MTTWTQAEIDLLLNLLRERKEEGSYFGNREAYYARLDRVMAKVVNLPTKAPKVKRLSRESMDAWLRHFEAELFPHQESEFEAESFTPQGRHRMATVIRKLVQAVADGRV